MYSGLGFHSAFDWDPLYYGNYGSSWARIPLPSQKMINEALPEGVLNHNGELEGFLYFQPVDPDDRQVTFRAALVDRRKAKPSVRPRFPSPSRRSSLTRLPKTDRRPGIQEIAGFAIPGQ